MHVYICTMAYGMCVSVCLSVRGQHARVSYIYHLSLGGWIRALSYVLKDKQAEFIEKKPVGGRGLENEFP